MTIFAFLRKINEKEVIKPRKSSKPAELFTSSSINILDKHTETLLFKVSYF